MPWSVSLMAPVRNRWAWLADLLQGGGAGASPSEAVADALTRLGFPAARMVEGLAAVLDVTPARLRDPDPATIARVDPERLATILAVLLRDGDPELSAIGQRWLAAPATAYQLPPPHLEHWLANGGPASALLAQRLEDEGLALVGDAALRRLATSANNPAVREAAARWVARFL